VQLLILLYPVVRFGHLLRTGCSGQHLREQRIGIERNGRQQLLERLECGRRRRRRLGIGR